MLLKIEILAIWLGFLFIFPIDSVESEKDMDVHTRPFFNIRLWLGMKQTLNNILICAIFYNLFENCRIFCTFLEFIKVI